MYDARFHAHLIGMARTGAGEWRLALAEYEAAHPDWVNWTSR